MQVLGGAVWWQCWHQGPHHILLSPITSCLPAAPSPYQMPPMLGWGFFKSLSSLPDKPIGLFNLQHDVPFARTRNHPQTSRAVSSFNQTLHQCMGPVLLPLKSIIQQNENLLCAYLFSPESHQKLFPLYFLDSLMDFIKMFYALQLKVKPALKLYFDDG